MSGSSDAKYKIFKSRNNETSSEVGQDISTLGDLPSIKPLRPLRRSCRQRSTGSKPPVRESSAAKSQIAPKAKNKRRSKLHTLIDQTGTDQNLSQNPRQPVVKPPVLVNASFNASKTILNMTVSQHLATAKKNAINISVIRQTLRANNKALAVALEHAKQEIKLLKRRNVELEGLNQELKIELSRVREDNVSFERRVEKVVHECVQTKADAIFDDFVEIMEDCKEKIMKCRHQHMDQTMNATFINTTLNKTFQLWPD